MSVNANYLPTKPLWRRTGATSTTPAVIYLPPGARHIKVLVDTDSYVAWGFTYAAPAVAAVNEVYTISTTGTPTGGNFTLEFDGLETAALTFDESAADVVTAMNNLANVASGDFVGAGGPLPTPITLTAGGVYAGTGPLPILKVGQNNLTGGTQPTVQVRRSTNGTGLNETDGGYAYLTADGSELFDIGKDPSFITSPTTRARYLYVAAASVAGVYEISGYVLA